MGTTAPWEPQPVLGPSESPVPGQGVPQGEAHSQLLSVPTVSPQPERAFGGKRVALVRKPGCGEGGAQVPAALEACCLSDGHLLTPTLWGNLWGPWVIAPTWVLCWGLPGGQGREAGIRARILTRVSEQGSRMPHVGRVTGWGPFRASPISPGDVPGPKTRGSDKQVGVMCSLWSQACQLSSLLPLQGSPHL